MTEYYCIILGINKIDPIRSKVHHRGARVSNLPTNIRLNKCNNNKKINDLPETRLHNGLWTYNITHWKSIQLDKECSVC